MSTPTTNPPINVASGLNSPLFGVFPAPRILKSAPDNTTYALPGQTAVVPSTQTAYTCVGKDANGYIWVTSPASGAGTFTAVTVDPGDVDIVAGDLNITAGDITATAGTSTLGILVAGDSTINGTLDVSGNTTLGGDLDVTGDVTVTGDFDITSASAISFTTTSNTNPAFSVLTNGGTTETLRLYVNQGTSASALDLRAISGGINMVAALSTHITDTGAAGVDTVISNTAGSFSLTVGESVADAIVLNASGAAGGLQLQAGSSGILVGNQADCAIISLGDVIPTSARTITVGGGTVATAIADTIDIAPDGVSTNAGASKVATFNNGGVTLGTLTSNIASGAITSGTHTVNIQAGNAAAGTVATNISTGTGTKSVNVGNADGGTTFTLKGVVAINASQNSNTAINSGTSTGTVTIGNGAAGAVTVDSGAGISIDAATASNLTAAAGDLTVSATAGSVVVSGGEAVIDAVQLTASNGAVQVTGGALAATTGLNVKQGAASALIQVGAGAPSHNAPQGSLYLRTDGSTTNDRAYINTDGTNGWTAITTAS